MNIKDLLALILLGILILSGSYAFFFIMQQHNLAEHFTSNAQYIGEK